MGIISAIKGLVSVISDTRVKEDFKIEPISSEQMNAWIYECADIYQGNPCWIDVEDGIDTVNFAKSVCAEIARLTMQGTSIKLSGSARADWLQWQVDRVYSLLQSWVEYGSAYGTIMLKPNGDTIDIYTPNKFDITHVTNAEIDGAVFYNQQKSGDKWFTRLEYHRFEGGMYKITNRCYASQSENDTGKPVDISETPWAALAEEVAIANIEKPLFAAFRMPQANNIVISSPYGLPAFSEAVQELRDLDIAYSRNSAEIFDSKRTVMVDKDRLLDFKEMAKTENALGRVKMPNYINLVDGDTTTQSDIYHEINPTLNTDARLTGLNALLSQIGYKAGFSNGYFVFNQSGGIQTATQVEADQQRTIQTIKAVRDSLEHCLDCLIYALNAFADLYGLAPAGAYEVAYDFGDITYSANEEKARWYGYVQAGKVPFWYYLVRFEGFTEQEAKALENAAQPKTPTLFGGEE